MRKTLLTLSTLLLFAQSGFAQAVPGTRDYVDPNAPQITAPAPRLIQQPPGAQPTPANSRQFTQPWTQVPGQFPPSTPPIPSQPPIVATIPIQNQAVLSKAVLRDIDRLVVQLSGYCQELHDEFHEHFEGERHAGKLDEDATSLERVADALHQFAVTADGGPQSVARLRADTNEFIQLSIRIARTIDLTEPWLRSSHAHTGVAHMREVARQAYGVALQIDRYLPVDTHVIDIQAERLEAAVMELHDEFHEHLEGYEVSQHLDADLEEVESLVEHMHELAHNRSWGEIDFRHLLEDINEVKQKTAHIESLFVRQAQIGVRTQDWIGIEHSRDAITDVLSSAYLLEHMIRKTAQPTQTGYPPTTNPNDRRPLRDRHGHEIRQYVPPVRDQRYDPSRGR